jgi:hypothetical protein
MKHFLKKIALGTMISLGCVAQVQAGAYMYCVNRNVNSVTEERLTPPCHKDAPRTEEIIRNPLNPSDPPTTPATCHADATPDSGSWTWSKWEKAAKFLVTDVAGEEGSDSDVWIYGQLGEEDLTHGYQNLRINTTDYAPYFDQNPAAFCQKLVKLCTDKFGPDYIFVGAGDGAVAGWNGISLSKTGDSPTTPLFTCPNWRSGAFIKTSSFEGTYSGYDVTCWKTTAHKGKGHFWVQEQTPSRTVWSNGTVTYGYNSADIDIEILDNNVGLFYCTGQPSE